MRRTGYFVLLLLFLLSQALGYDPDFEVPDEYLPNWDRYIEFLDDMESHVGQFDHKKYRKEVMKENLVVENKDESGNDEEDTVSDDDQESRKLGNVLVNDDETPDTNVQTTSVDDEDTEDDDYCGFYCGPVNGKGTVSIAANYGTSNLTPYSPYGPTWINTAFYLPCPYPYYPFLYEDNPSPANYQDYYWPSSYNELDNLETNRPAKLTVDNRTVKSNKNGSKNSKIKIVDGSDGKEIDEVVIKLYVEGKKHPVDDAVVVESAASVPGNVQFNGMVPASGVVRIGGHF